MDHVVEFDQYTEPMKQLLADFAEQPETDFVVSSAHPRVVDGKRIDEPALSADSGRTWRIRANSTWRRSRRGWRAEFPRRARFICR